MEYDQLLEYLSAFGWFNLVILILAGLSNAFMSYNNLAANFLAASQEHWCRVPELEHLPLEEQRRLAIPWDDTTGKYESCRMYDRSVWGNFSEDNLLSWNRSDLPVITHCQHGWTFDGLRSTIVTEWGLVCEHAWIVDLISPVFIAGLLAGSMITANITTTLGRKRSLLCFLTATTVCGVCAAMATHVAIYILCRTLLAITSIGIITTGYIVVAELTPAKHREWAGVVYQLFYPLGAILAGALAVGLPSWRNLQAACALSATPLIILILWLVPESPRWLAFAGHKEKAAAVLSRLAQLNRAPIPAAVLQEYTLPGKIKHQGETDSRPVVPLAAATAKDLLTNPTARLYFIIVSFTWTTAVYMYSAVSYNLDGLFDSTSVTMALCGALEASTLLLSYALLKFIGRRLPLMLFMGVAVLCAVSAVPIQLLYGRHVAVSVLYLVCRSCGAGSSYVLMVLTVELFPTSIGNLAIGYASAICYAVTTTAPFIAGALTEYWLPIPNVVYGTMCLINLGLLIWLPETKGRQTPESIPAMEALRREMPRSQLKSNLVYVAQSTIVDQISTAGDIINPKELGVIDEVVKSHREVSLNAIPQGPNVKPVFIVVPEGTDIAEIDHFVLQKVEEALQTGEGFDNKTYAKHRVFDLDAFRDLHYSQSLGPGSIRSRSQVPTVCTCGNQGLWQGYEAISLAGSSHYPGTPRRASGCVSAVLHHVLHEKHGLVTGSISKVTGSIHKVTGQDDLTEKPIGEDKSHSDRPALDIPPSFQQVVHPFKSLIHPASGAPEGDAPPDMDSHSPSLSEIAIEMDPCGGFDNISYIPDEVEAEAADTASLGQCSKRVPQCCTCACHLTLDNIERRGSHCVIPENEVLGTSHTLDGFIYPPECDIRVTQGDLGFLPTVQPLYQAIVEELEVEDLGNERFLTRL